MESAVKERSDKHVMSLTSICASAMKRRILVRQTLGLLVNSDASGKGHVQAS